MPNASHDVIGYIAYLSVAEASTTAAEPSHLNLIFSQFNFEGGLFKNLYM